MFVFLTLCSQGDLAYAKENECGNEYFAYPSAVDPLQGQSLLLLPGHLTTSIQVVSEESETVAFIGTADGHVLKVHSKHFKVLKELVIDIDNK